MNALNGTWRVIVRSGPWWFWLLDWVGNKKIIKGAQGYNRIGFFIRWGRFDISKENGEYILKYRRMPIADNLVLLEEDRANGQFYWQGKFQGKFSMIREGQP